MAHDFSLHPETCFAAAEREPIDAIVAERAQLLGSGAAAAILDAIHEPLAIVNESRQIVHANNAFLAFAAAVEVDEILGMRPGEFLGCTHAVGAAGGCGTEAACRTCGVVNSVLCATSGAEMRGEADIAVEIGGRSRHLQFDVTAAPFRAAGRRFVLMTIAGARWTSAR